MFKNNFSVSLKLFRVDLREAEGSWGRGGGREGSGLKYPRHKVFSGLYYFFFRSVKTKIKIIVFIFILRRTIM